jgi:glucosamine--fructose-6-phosphate aminotransferase (isomerizing)
MLADTWALGGPADVWQSLADHLGEVGKQAEDTVDVLVEGVADSVAADVVGAGASLTAAEEGALMLREACRLPAAAYETRQYLHGPMESAGRTAHIVLGDEREAALALQLADAGHRVLYVGPCAAPVPHVEIPRLAPVARAIVENVVLQRLVVKVAAARNVPVGEFVFSMDDTKVDALTPETA